MSEFYAAPPKVFPGDKVSVQNTRFKNEVWEDGVVVDVTSYVYRKAENIFTLRYSYTVRCERKTAKLGSYLLYVSEDQIEPIQAVEEQ